MAEDKKPKTPSEYAVSRPYKGLYTDGSYTDQPQGTTSFALNAVRDTDQGNENLLSNEEANAPCGEFPEGYVPIGKVYLEDGNTAIFLINELLGLSEIGILSDHCTYETHVNTNLEFRIDKQIDAVYKLRRGCERTIYFTDDLNKPRVYNFDKPQDFKTSSNTWDLDKFNLFKTYDKIPTFSRIELQETGQILPGSYNFSIQYLDSDLNPTEWITTTDTVIIYNDNSTTKTFEEIRGSNNKPTFYSSFGATNKAINLYLTNLDTEFPYYRLAIIEANTGSGSISRVLFSEEIATSVNNYLYTGNNGYTEGTVEEIAQFNAVIDKAAHIEQIENRLVLADTQGKQINYCNLQSYASRIKADLVTERIKLNDTGVSSNPKRGQVHNEKVGYMPGEIYSFGIVYVFEDGTTSPAYHIPGKGRNDNTNQMSTDNKCENTTYQEADSCNGKGYWGVDVEGNPLVNTKVRHHRFPLRSEVRGENLPLVSKDFLSPETLQEETSRALYLFITGEIDPVEVTETQLNYQVTYTVGGVTETKTFTIDVASYTEGLKVLIADSLESLALVEVLEDKEGTLETPYSGLVYGSGLEVLNSSSRTSSDIDYYTNIFGINFLNVEVPNSEDTGGYKVVGYYIVRHERTENDRTILDTGVLTPLLKQKAETGDEDKYIAHGHLRPDSTRVQKDIYALIHPEHKFNQKEYTNATSIVEEGNFYPNGIGQTLYGSTYNSAQFKSSRILQDVQSGTSYDPKINKKREADDDGYSMQFLNRHTNLTYFPKDVDDINNPPVVYANQIKEVFYLNPIFSKTITRGSGAAEERKEVYNLSADNQIGIIQFNKDINFKGIPYVVIKRALSDAYSNFRTLPYYKETTNYIPFVNQEASTAAIYNGDSYISSMKYINSMFYDIRLKPREIKRGIGRIILGALTVVAGVALTIVGSATGIGAAAGIAVIGAGVALTKTGLDFEKAGKIYEDLYKEGLRDTVDDNFTSRYFNAAEADDDDTIQWFYESLSDLWFESNVNMNWRQGATSGITDFMPSPAGFNSELNLQYFINKTTTLDPEAKDGRNYQGFAKSELYEINPDYLRRDREKSFFALGLEYDCCSDCIEDFPHRIHWSQQSFQEELIDNYATFLPNNYKDIEGETGQITNVFRIQNNLYLHTKEGLWHLPQTLQERVTGDIVSFIGTGEFFDIPPRAIVDGTHGSSAGSDHKWGTLKTPHGVFFISHKESVIYRFNGNKLDPISNKGMYNWLKENIPVQRELLYFNTNSELFPYRNNPSNALGTGYLMTYDSRKERVIVTKKDFVYDKLPTTTYVYREAGINYLFSNYKQLILDRKALGEAYLGIEQGRMIFGKLSSNAFTVNVLGVEINVEGFINTYIDGIPKTDAELKAELELLNNSFTLSYSLKTQSWQSFHSYMPHFYVHTPNQFSSWLNIANSMWKHNIKHYYQRFYNVEYPFIVEYVSNSNPLQTRVWEGLRLLTEAFKHDVDLDEATELRYVTFNKAIFYNSRQTTGELELVVKKTNVDDADFLLQQTQNIDPATIVLDRNEKNWTINELRDIRVDYDKPIFNKNLKDRNAMYYIDKLLNKAAIDVDKNWQELETLRDKYLTIRLIFDNLNDVKLLLNYSVENEKQSPR